MGENSESKQDRTITKTTPTESMSAHEPDSSVPVDLSGRANTSRYSAHRVRHPLGGADGSSDFYFTNYVDDDNWDFVDDEDFEKRCKLIIVGPAEHPSLDGIAISAGGQRVVIPKYLADFIAETVSEIGRRGLVNGSAA
jgi:hypothetical protein